eukprot:XP_011680663.1 PREDICTED: rhamnose-binding lectin [Strongylocentrotus purpuratus]
MFMVFIVCSYIYKIKSSTMSIKFWAYFFLVLGISATHISGEGVVTTELLCDGDPAILIDGGDLLIHVQSSFYGRATDDLCNSTPSPTPPGAEVLLPCSSPSAPVLINNICHLGRACILVADNGIFGAPCNGTTEYLMITYVLLPPTQTLPTTSASPTTMPITSAPPTTMSTTSAPPTTISTTSATPITTVEKFVVAICEGSKTVLSCTNGRINICSALYGRTEADICPRDNMDSNTNCMATGVFDTISCCTGLSQCAVTASDSVFGDPCPDTYKYLQITYTCEPENELPPQTLMSVDICEGEWEPRLNCPDGQTISICSSIYGRSDTTTCPDTSATTSNVDCMSLNPLYVRTTCQGRQSCIVFAGDRNLGGDPCPDTHKYLHIDYRCVAE